MYFADKERSPFPLLSYIKWFNKSSPHTYGGDGEKGEMKMKKRLLAVALTGVIGASMVIPAMAATSGGVAQSSAGSTDIIAGVMVDDEDMKLKVEVPTTFAFVVNGTVGTQGKSDAITVESGGLLLPNVKVKVDKPSTGEDTKDGTYHLEIGELGNWKFTNYSTRIKRESGDEGKFDPATDRVGVAVDVWGAVQNEGTPSSRNYWNHVATGASGEAGFKQYTLSVKSDKVVAKGAANSETGAEETVKFATAQDDGTLAMPKAIRVPAPDATAGVDKVTKYALAGAEADATFNVEVGGVRGNYTQVEESAKVGTVIWTIQTPTTEAKYNTAPNRPYQNAAEPVSP